MLANELLRAWIPRDTTRRLVVGVSGGADSVALLLALVELGWQDRMTVAHFNHHWRGAESDADEAFVNDLCRRWQLPARFGSPSPPSSQNDISTSRDSAMLAKETLNASEGEPVGLRSEESARNLRYDFLIRVAYETGASYVLTAHTADDRIETVLHNLLRGTGLNGVSSLNVRRNLDEDLLLVRPLLHTRRRDIESYLQSRDQPYRTDSSNSSTAYARNFIRHELLPLARSRYPQADDNLLSFSEVVADTLADLQDAASLWLHQVDTARKAINEADKLNCHQPSTALSVSPDHRIAIPHEAFPAHWITYGYWILPAECLAGIAWPILREALRSVWLKRHWPLRDMSRQHWLKLRELLLDASETTEPTADLRICTMLPGEVQLESFRGTFALGRRHGRAGAHRNG